MAKKLSEPWISALGGRTTLAGLVNERMTLFPNRWAKSTDRSRQRKRAWVDEKEYPWKESDLQDKSSIAWGCIWRIGNTKWTNWRLEHLAHFLVFDEKDAGRFDDLIFRTFSLPPSSRVQKIVIRVTRVIEKSWSVSDISTLCSLPISLSFVGTRIPYDQDRLTLYGNWWAKWKCAWSEKGVGQLLHSCSTYQWYEIREDIIMERT